MSHSTGPRRRFTSEQDAQILAEYNSGQNAPQLAAKWGMSKATIRTVILRSGGKMRARGSDVANRPRKHTMTHDFFDEITTPTQAYVLGFVAGDGCIHSHLRAFSIGLAARDRSHLFKIHDALQATCPVFDEHKTLKDGRVLYGAKIQFFSQRLVAGLVKQGLGPRKSMALKPWSGPAEILPAYYLGLIDADGAWIRDKCGSWKLQLVGSLDSMEGFARFVEAKTGHYVSPRPHSTIHLVVYHGLLFLQSLARMLYASSPLWL